jgi:zinc transport system substrate-binding protein
VALTACGSGGGTTPTSSGAPGPQALTVVVGFYPLQYAAEQVGGQTVSVANLTPPGAEPHDLELTPQQVAQIAEADLVIYISGFQPALDEAVAQQAADRAIDVLDVVDPLTTSGATDPHIWLDPEAMAEIGTAIADRLITLEPTQNTTIAADLRTFTESMTELNSTWTAGTATCRSRDLVVSHEAFGYLARAYDFVQIGISGLSPDAEPSPATIARISAFVRDNVVTTIYYETLVDPKVAQTIAAETGAMTAVLDPIEGLPVGSTANYVTLMQANLATLIAGQQCS